MTTAPVPAPVQGGGGTSAPPGGWTPQARGIPTVAEAYQRGLVSAAAQAAIDATPVGGPVPFLEPQTPDEFDKTAERHKKAMGDFAKSSWDTIFANRFGKEPSEAFYQRWASHDTDADPIAVYDQMTGEPVVDPTTGKPMLNDWLQSLYDICGYQARKDLMRYATIKAGKEREMAKSRLITDSSTLEVGV